MSRSVRALHSASSLATTFAAVTLAGVACATRAAYPDGAPVLIADVVNATGDRIFDRAMLEAASVALRQSRHVRPYPRSRLPRIYGLMGISNKDTTLSFELAQEVAERDHVRCVLGLWLSQTATGFTIIARLADVEQHRVTAELTESSRTREGVVHALDAALAGVRRQLGESPRDVANRTPLPLITTSSLEALRAYADGSGAWAHGDWPRAKEYWERAVDLDTGFAMALGALGTWHYYAHDREAGERFYAAAFARSSRLTEWEHLDLRATRAFYRRNTDSSLYLARLRAARYPGADTWTDLGTALMRADHDSEAIDAFQRGLRLDSLRVFAWINLATSNTKLGRYEQSRLAYTRAERVDSTALYQNNINNEYGQVLVRLGRLAEAESAFRRMANAPRIANRALGLRSLALLEFWRGRLDDAIDDLGQAIDATRQTQSPLSEGRNHLFLATVYRAANRVADANTEVSKALALAATPEFEPAMLGILAYECDQLDRVPDVDRVAAMTRARAHSDDVVDQASVAFTAAVAHAAHHRPDSALTYLSHATNFPWPAPRLMLKAEAFSARRQSDSVTSTLLALRSGDGFGAEGEDDWLRAPLLLGDALLAANDTAGAMRRYQDVVSQWREAPADLPDLVAAKARLSAIAGPRRESIAP